MSTWKYTDATHTVVSCTLENGGMASCSAAAKEVQDWISAGNTPLPYEPLKLSPAEQISALQVAVQARLDAFAQERYYDGILSACTYAAGTVPNFKSDGQTCVNARDLTWGACFKVLGEVKAGKRQIPTEEELLAMLPALKWPA